MTPRNPAGPRQSAPGSRVPHDDQPECLAQGCAKGINFLSENRAQGPAGSEQGRSSQGLRWASTRDTAVSLRAPHCPRLPQPSYPAPARAPPPLKPPAGNQTQNTSQLLELQLQVSEDQQREEDICEKLIPSHDKNSKEQIVSKRTALI